MSILKKLLPVFILLSLSYWSIQPFFATGFFSIHDDTQVQRVFEMKQSLADGMFPVRWVSDLGYNYGYPIFNFYAPFAYYVGGFLNLAGFDALIATKIMMVLGVLLAGVFMYFLAKEFWGKAGGILAGLLYVYAPYHAINIYVRGAVSELWAYAFVPLAFLGIYKIFFIVISKKANQKQLWLWIAAGAIGYAGIILSHNLTAMMVTPFLFIFAVCLYIKAHFTSYVHRPYFILLSLLFGILLSAFYWLPTLQEMQYTNVISQIGGKSNYKLHFVCPMQLWNSPWGFGGSTLGCVDGMSFKIGKLHLLFGAVSLLALVILARLRKFTSFIFLFFTFVLIVSLFLMIQESLFIWKAFPQMAFFQFPWRFLIMVSFTLSLLGGASVWLVEQGISRFHKYKTIKKMQSFIIYGTIMILAAGIILVNMEIFTVQTVFSKTATDYTNKSYLTWITSKISDEYMPKDFRKPKKQTDVPVKKIILQDSNATVTVTQEKTQELQARISAPQETTATLNIAYFPAWHLYIDGKEVSYERFNKGLLVTIPAGEHILQATFISTTIEQVGNMLSLTGVIALLLGIIITQRKESHAKKST